MDAVALWYAFAAWLVLLAVTDELAARKGRSRVGWILLNLTMSPAVILLLLVLPPRGAAAISRSPDGREPR